MRDRVDRLLVSRGLAPSREKAQALIMAGDVRVGEEVIRTAGQLVDEHAPLAVAAPPKYVSRGGLKLEGALEGLGVVVTGRSCADVGASTGGFTDCLLQYGARHVHAIDVGYGQLDYKLRSDPRVTIYDRTNARYVESLPEPVDLVTVDASFISLRLLLKVVQRWLTPEGSVLAMVKPQFEAGKNRVGKGGVVRDPAIRVETLEGVAASGAATGLRLRGVCPSPITGPAGNHEYFLWLTNDTATPELPDIASAIRLAVYEDVVSVAC